MIFHNSHDKAVEDVATHYNGSGLAPYVITCSILAVLVQVASVWRFVLMSKFIRLGHLLNPINGGLGMTYWSVSQVWRISKCLVAIPLSLVRPEWYVVTSGMQSIDLPCEWDCSDSVMSDFSHLLDLGMDE